MSVPSIFRMFEGVAFWASIVLTLGYPALLLAIDQGMLPGVYLFVFVLGHLCTLVIGHRHGGSTPPVAG